MKVARLQLDDYRINVRIALLDEALRRLDLSECYIFYIYGS
jgi:hypothetical protein